MEGVAVGRALTFIDPLFRCDRYPPTIFSEAHRNRSGTVGSKSSDKGRPARSFSTEKSGRSRKESKGDSSIKNDGQTHKLYVFFFHMISMSLFRKRKVRRV